jgi:hypothetical protein
MKSFQPLTAAVLGIVIVSCGGGGGGNPITPAPVATPTPVAVATPTPAPTPEPTPEGEPPVVRETAPVRITLRLFVVEDGRGGVYQYQENSDGQPIIPGYYKFRLDIIAKDAKNKETRGSGEVIWHWNEDMIDVDNMNNIYHPTLRALKAGQWCAQAELDKIFSNELCLEFRFPN